MVPAVSAGMCISRALLFRIPLLQYQVTRFACDSRSLNIGRNGDLGLWLFLKRERKEFSCENISSRITYSVLCIKSLATVQRNTSLLAFKYQ